MKEITLENEAIRVSILPELGGKVRSAFFKSRDFEAAAQPGRGKQYRLARPDGAFGDYDMSGIDDAFPNIDADTLTYEGRALTYPDHGEIWSRGMDVKESDDRSARLFLHSERFGYDYIKTIRLEENNIRFYYEVRNRGEMAFPCLWTMHGLLRFEKDMRFIYPEGVQGFENVLLKTPLGEKGRVYKYPNDEVDFDHLPFGDGRESEYYVKYYCPDKIGKGECGIYYPSKQVRINYSYDSSALPWLGVWINAGGLGGDYNVAMEMTNGYYDGVRLAMDNKRGCILKPDDLLEFEVNMSIIAQK